MANQWGVALRLSIFGESHGRGIGMVVDGLPAGEKVDMEGVQREMARRAPGTSELSTARREPDRVEIISGLLEGHTTGAPLCGLIENRDARSSDYDTKIRPGHADLSALQKYLSHADLRGGGHFSGRLTAPLVFAGALARQVLERRGVAIYGRITEIAGIGDRDGEGAEEYAVLPGRAFPVFDEAAGERMKAAILDARGASDSVGGVVEAVACFVPPGLGEPFFRSVESVTAAMLFSIPAVKGVEFGRGFDISRLRGSEANDAVVLEKNVLRTRTNNNGGILGGITTGMPLTVRAAFKPTPTIGVGQDTVDMSDMSPARIASLGRHDPCVVPRAVPVVEAALALCLLDLFLEAGRFIKGCAG